ncbi:helix-turn-helix transcriptional regulator [Nocardia sp. NPDC059246]|uniref:helix-turn-helix transcriptional regulator n=1 Tax=unclassified Nocardia TaxID=2637762 RepID=UPI0036A9B80B
MRQPRDTPCDTRRTDSAHRDSLRTARDSSYAPRDTLRTTSNTTAQTTTPRGHFMNDDRYLQAKDCEELTGIPASTWRYWAHIGSGPVSFKLGRRRVWRKSVILAWIAEQESATGGVA